MNVVSDAVSCVQAFSILQNRDNANMGYWLNYSTFKFHNAMIVF